MKTTSPRSLGMQRGGFDIIPLKDSDFKYTTDPDRILWTKNVFPIAEYIIAAIQTIPWSTYKFEGTSQFWKSGAGSFIDEELEISTLPLNSNNPSRYYYFGGSVYEIMNKLYTRPDMPNLRSYVDPTGDLDVMLILPQIVLPEGKYTERYFSYFFRQLPYGSNERGLSSQRPAGSGNGILYENNENVNRNNGRNSPPIAEPPELYGCSRNVFENENRTVENTERDPRRYSALIEHYTDWIMDQFTDNLRKYGRGGLLQALFGNAVKFNLDNDSEGKYADRIICIGNVKFVRSFLPYMNLIKLQLIAKFKGMSHSDHICEFLLEMPSEITHATSLRNFEQQRNTFQILKGFPLTTFSELVRGNIDSCINRYSFFNTNLRHKFYNHVGRMQYLNDFFKRNINTFQRSDPAKLSLSVKEYMDLGKQMAIFSFYVAENYFNLSIFNFDYKKRFRANMPEGEKRNLRNSLLRSLLGNYPPFLVQKRSYRNYLSAVQRFHRNDVSPFKEISFSEGQPIPARTKFVIQTLFLAVQVPKIAAIVKYNGHKLNTLQLYQMLDYLKLLTIQ